MKSYTVFIPEVVMHSLTVQAESEEDALRIAAEQVEAGADLDWLDDSHYMDQEHWSVDEDAPEDAETEEAE